MEKDIVPIIKAQQEVMDAGFMVTCTVLIFLFSIGVALFNASLGAKKNCLTNLSLGVFGFVVAIVEYVFIGHSMLKSTQGNIITNNINKFFFTDMNSGDNFNIITDMKPYLINSIIELFITALTLSVLCGAFMERARPSAAIMFMFLWTILIHNVVVYWTTNPNSFIFKLGIINMAGGGPNICMGIASLVYSWYLGERNNKNEFLHSRLMLVTSTIIIWLGWMGVGGSLTKKLDARALIAMINYTLAGIFGGLAWFIKSLVVDKKRFDIVAFCFGAIGSFIVVSPCVGSIEFYSAIIIGIVGAFVCNYAVYICQMLKIDDTINVFAFQGVGSFVGLLLAGIFTRENLYNLNDKYTITGGWLSDNWMQIFKQLLFGVLCVVWSMLLSLTIILFIEKVCQIRLRVEEKEETRGLDESYIGAFAYSIEEMDNEKITVSQIISQV